MKTKIELLNEAMFDAGRNNQNVPVMERVMQAVHDATESWQDGDLGLDLAYLVHAVLTESSVQWPDDRPTLHLFRELFPEGDDIWKHITVVPS